MRILISAEQIERRIDELARQITEDYAGRPLTLVGVLTGSLMFVADLVRQLHPATRIGFVQASSYRGPVTSPGSVEIMSSTLPDLRDRHVLLLDDILDTGQTLVQVMANLRERRPRSLKIAVLLRKLGRQRVPLEPDYCGFEIPDVFVVGYGLDYNDDYRQLPYVAVLDGEVSQNAECA